MDVEIGRELLCALLEAAAAEPEREICGLLFGSRQRIEHAIPAKNVAADPRRAFEIDPHVLFAAHRDQRRGGPFPIGHYHSHPSGSAEPSAADLAAAEPGRLWLIIGGSDARLWLAEPGRFREQRLIVREGSA